MDQRNSPILDVRGQPFRREVLEERIAGPTSVGGRSVFTGHPAQGLTPIRLAGLLRSAEEGDTTAYLELAEEIEEKDLHYLAVMTKRKQAISQLPVSVIAADDSAEARRDADLVEEFLDRDELQDEIIDLLDAIGKGFAVSEMVWDTSRTPWMPTLERVDPRWMEFDRTDMHRLRLRNDHGIPQDLPAYKFIIHRMSAKSGTTIRGGLARAAAWHYCFKTFAWKDWIEFLEKFGVPFPVGKYENGTSDQDKAKLLHAVMDLRSRGAAIFPKSMDVDFVDPKMGTSPADLWTALIDKCDEYLSKLVLGQTNTTDAKSGGLGSGQAEVHREVEESIERSDARRLASTLNRHLVMPLVFLNNGPRDKYPKLKIGREDPVDVAAMTAAARVLVPMGVKVSANKMRELAGLPEPEGDDEILLPPGSGGAPADGSEGTPENLPQNAPGGVGRPQGPKRRPPALLRPLTGLPARIGDEGETAGAEDGAEQARDDVDRMADAWLDDWEELAEPMVNQVAAALAEATSAAEARTALAGLAALDDDALVDALTGAGLAARLQGELDVQTEQEAG